MAASSFRMLPFKCRICPTRTSNSTLSRPLTEACRTCSRPLSLLRLSRRIKMPRPASKLLILFFRVVRSFTSEGDCLGAKLRPASQRASGHLWIGMPEIWKKLTLITELCYFCLYGKDCLGEADRLRVFPRSKGLRKPVWNHCSRGCRIISVN